MVFPHTLTLVCQSRNMSQTFQANARQLICPNCGWNGSFNRIGSSLGIGIASLVNALNPELVVLGGPISLGWEFLRPAIDQELHTRALRWHQESAKIVLARHGADACVMGGVAAVYNHMLARPSDRLTTVALPVYFS